MTGNRFTYIIPIAILMLTVPMLSVADSTNFLSLGIDLFNHHLYNLASQQFQKYIRLNPTASDLDLSQFYLAHCDQSLGNFAQAIQEYRNLLITYPGSSLLDVGFLELSRCYASIGDQPNAEKALRKALSLPLKKETNFSAHSELARLLYKKNQLNEAANIYRQLLTAYPNAAQSPWETFRLAQVYITQNDYSSALSALQAITADNSPPLLKSLALYYQARCLGALGEFPKALEMLSDESIFADKIQIPRLFLLFCLQVKLNDFSSAKTTLDRLQSTLELSPVPESGILDYQENADQLRVFSAGVDSRLGNYIDAESCLAQLYSQSPNTQTRAQALFLIAYLNYVKKNYRFALEYFEKFAKEFPDHQLLVQARYYQGWCLFKMGEYRKAKDSFSLLFTDYPQISESPSFAFLIAECEYKTNDYALARKSFQDFAESFPESNLYLDGLLRIADCHFNLGEYDKAISVYQNFIANYPDSPITPDAYFGLGNAYQQSNNTSEMRQVYYQFIKRFPDNDMADDSALAIVKSLYAEKDYSGCIDSVNELLGILSSDELLYNILWYRGRSLYDLGKYNSALEVFQRIARDSPPNPIAQDALYSTYLTNQKLGKYPNPLSASEAFLNEHPGSSLAPKVKILVAQYYADDRNYNYAEKLLQEILSASSDSSILADASQKLADIYRRQGMYVDAAEVYKKLAERTKGSSERYDYLLSAAGLYTDGGLAEEAIDTYQVLLDEIPNDPRISLVLYNLGLIYKDLHMYESGQVVLEKLVHDWPKSNEYILGCFQLAFVYQYLGKPAEAIKYHQIVVEKGSSDLAVQSVYWIGQCYYDMNNPAKAKAWLEQLVQNYPTYTAWVNKANALLEQIY
jgi:tetratricopeptide (TPR) repeat protein